MLSPRSIPHLQRRCPYQNWQTCGGNLTPRTEERTGSNRSGAADVALLRHARDRRLVRRAAHRDHSAKPRLCPGTALVRCAAVPPDVFHMVLRHAPTRCRTFRRGCSARERLPARRRDGTIEPPPRGSAAHRRDRRGTRRRGCVGAARRPARPLGDTTALRRRRFARLFTRCVHGIEIVLPVRVSRCRRLPVQRHGSLVVLNDPTSFLVQLLQPRLAPVRFAARSACGIAPLPAVRDRRKQRPAPVLPLPWCRSTRGRSAMSTCATRR